MAPEIILNNNYDEKCDVWSFGCMMCDLLKINLHQLKSNLYEICHYISSYKGEYINIDCNYILIKKFIEKCLTFDLKNRPSFENLITSDIFSDTNNDLFEYLAEKKQQILEDKTTDYSLESNEDSTHDNSKPINPLLL